MSGFVSAQQVRAKIIALNVPLIPKPIAEAELATWAAGVVARSASGLFERALARMSEQCGLTTSEVDVVRAARNGSAEYKEIAARLNRSVETVRSHVKNIRRKARTRSLRELLERLADRS